MYIRIIVVKNKEMNKCSLLIIVVGFLNIFDSAFWQIIVASPINWRLFSINIVIKKSINRCFSKTYRWFSMLLLSIHIMLRWIRVIIVRRFRPNFRRSIKILRLKIYTFIFFLSEKKLNKRFIRKIFIINVINKKKGFV